MPKDKDVQTDEVPEGTESKADESLEGEDKSEEQPFTEAQETRLQQLISEAEQQGYDKGSREMQGKKDREVAEAQRSARYYQTLATGYDLGDLSPEEAEAKRNKAELAALKGERAAEQRSQQAQAAVDGFEKTFASYVKDLGIDPKNIDWGEDVPISNPSYFQVRQQRILSSVAKVQKETAKAEKDSLEQQKKDLEAKEREEANSVSTDASGGAAIKDWRKLDPRDQISQGLKEGQKKNK